MIKLFIAQTDFSHHRCNLTFDNGETPVLGFGLAKFEYLIYQVEQTLCTGMYGFNPLAILLGKLVVGYEVFREVRV